MRFILVEAPVKCSVAISQSIVDPVPVIASSVLSVFFVAAIAVSFMSIPNVTAVLMVVTFVTTLLVAISTVAIAVPVRGTVFPPTDSTGVVGLGWT